MIFPEFKAGMRIGRDPEEQKKPYVLDKPLGDGGQAQVWRAKKYGDRGFFTEVALKLLDSSPAPNQTTEQHETLFFSEAMVTSRLQNSDHFVKVHDAFRDPTYNLFGIEMELLYGVDLLGLSALFAKYPHHPPIRPNDHPRNATKQPTLPAALPWEVAFSLFTQVLQGLDHAHTAKDPEGQPLNLIHRDIKPQNLMLCHNGRIKIIDLGIARWDQRDDAVRTQEKMTKGTLGYVAPEIILRDEAAPQSKHDQASPQSDLFAAGVVLYELLTTMPPFAPTSIWEYVMSIASMETSPPPHPSDLVPSVPREAGDLVMRLIAKKPTTRPASAHETLSLLNQYLRRHKAHMSSDDLKHWYAQLRGEETPTPPRTALYDLSEAQAIAKAANSSATTNDLDLQPPAPPSSTQEAAYYAPTVMRMPSPLQASLPTVQTEIDTDQNDFTPPPMVSHPDLKPFTPPAPKNNTPKPHRTFQQPHDTDPYSAQEMPQEMRPPTGMLVGFEDEESFSQALEEANQRMPTQQDLGLAHAVIAAQTHVPEPPDASEALVETRNLGPKQGHLHASIEAANRHTEPPDQRASSRMPLFLGGGLLLLALVALGGWIALRPPQHPNQFDAGTLAYTTLDAGNSMRVASPERKAPVLVRLPSPALDAGPPEERTAAQEPPEERAPSPRRRRKRRKRRRRPVYRTPDRYIEPTPPTRLVIERTAPRRITPPEHRVSITRKKEKMNFQVTFSKPCDLQIRGVGLFGENKQFQLTLQEGLYELRCTNLYWRKKLRVVEGMPQHIHQSIQLGRIMFFSDQPCEVWLPSFGRIGRSLQTIPVPSGTHTFLLVSSRDRSLKKQVKMSVQSGETSRKAIVWNK